MDCTGRTMNICLILFVISITGGQGQFYSNRDIILTPNQLKTYPGKVLYYRPRDHPAPAPTEEKANGPANAGGAVPWEEVLKETVFLALNDNKTSHQQQHQSSGSTLLDNAPLLAAVKRQQKAIYNAPYVGAVDLSVPRFGDIVELAHGRLERDADDEDSYVFIQQRRPEDGASGEEGAARAKPRNLTALWKVERIRHRDELRGHRYELKFTIVPALRSSNVSHAEDLPEEPVPQPPNNRTFIVRDEDYPRYFGASSPNAILPVVMLRKNDQPLYERMFFDPSPATRYYRPAQQTITLGQYLVQSLLSGGDPPKYHHHQHHLMPSGKFAFPATTLYAGASSGRIKFPDSFTTASHNVPKFYHHIHFPRPSIAPLAPTAVPGAFLLQHAKDTHAPASSNIQQDYTKLAPAVQEPSQEAPRPNQVVQKPQPQPQQQQPVQQQRPKQFGTQFPSQPQAPLAPQHQHVIYRPQQQQQVQVQQQSPQQPLFIHPQSVSGPGPYLQSLHPGAMAGPFSAPQQSHIIQSIPFYSPQGPMVLNHIPVMSNHHLAIQMAPPAPIAIPVHVQLLPPAAQIYASPAPPPQQDGLQAIPVRIMQPFPNPPPPSFHLYSSSPVNPFLPPSLHQQQHRHPITVTVTPKTTTHHPAANQTSSSLPPSSSPPSTVGHQHGHPSHPHLIHSPSHKATGHPFSALPTVFKFTSSNAIHPQKVPPVVTGPTPPHHRHTPLVQLSGPSIGPTTQQRGHPHRFSTPTAPTALGIRSSTAPVTFPPSPTAATRPGGRSTVAVVGQVSGPTAASSVHHRYAASSPSSAALPTVPASPAGLREQFSAPAFQPAGSESKQAPRKLEPPPASPSDTVGAPSNAVSPKYESFGVENAVTPTATATATATHSLPRSSPSTPTSGSSFGTSLRPGGSTTSFSNFIDASGAVSVTAKLIASESPAPRARPPGGSSTTPLAIAQTTQPTYVPSKPKTTYIQQLGPTIGGKYPPAFKSMPSVTILPPQIETPISSTLKTYQYLTHHHHDTYDFIPSRVVELAHVKKLAGQKHSSGKRSKQQKAAAAAANNGGSVASPAGHHHKHSPAAQHHHVTVTSNKPLRFYPGDGPEHATHRPEAQLSVQLPPPEKEFTTTYYGTPKHNQKVQRPKNFVTPLHPYQGPASTTPMPAVTASMASSGAPPSASTTPEPTPARNTSTSTFRSATASSTAHYYTKNRHEKSDDLTTMAITTMRPRMVLKTLYRQFPASFLPSTSTVSGSSSVSTEKPVQKWLPKRPRTKSTSGEYSTSTLPSSSSSSSASDPVVASSDHSPDVVTKLPLIVPSVTVAQQMSARVRASRGRSRFTYRRIPSGNPPPIPTGQQQQATRMGRMRTVSAWATTTTTPKPISAVVDGSSNRIDERSSYEQQERKAEQTVMAAAPTDKIKRDAEAAVAEQLVAKQVDNRQDALEVPEKEYVMVKASVQPVHITNAPNVLFFEASDATTPAEVARSLGSTIEDLTMSIINHAKAIVNQTGPETLATPEESVPTTTTTGKPIESNEISHREETTVQDAQDTSRPPAAPIDETVVVASVTAEGVTAASETTIATTIASTTLDDVELDDADDERRTTAIAYLS